MGIESEEIAEALHSDDSAGRRIILRDSILEKDFQGFPCAPAQVGQERSVVKEEFEISRPGIPSLSVPTVCDPEALIRHHGRSGGALQYEFTFLISIYNFMDVPLVFPV